MTTIKQRERRDWALLIFLVPIGIMLIIIVGQLAVRMVPTWSVDAGMGSNLEPDSESARPFALLQPILPQILTPVAWAESYLTPNGDVSFPPFLTFEPTATPSPTAATPSPTENTPTATTTASPTSTVTVTVTSTPPTPTKTDTDEPDTPTPSATVSPSPTTPSPSPTTPSPSPTTPSPSPTTPSPSPTTPSPTGVISTMPPSYGTPAPIPSQVGVGTLPDNTNPSSDTNVGTVLDGTYIVVNLSVTVSSSPDDNYDLAIYEYNSSGYVYMDWMIVGITNSSDGSQYYEVFNWGNGNPDTNSNLGDVAGEIDDQQVDGSEFYDPDGAGTAPQSGILIDVDTASSSPPPATYNYVVIISPIGGMPSNNAQVDALQTVEVPTPTP
ncbi:MAG: hypothetical protein J0L96_04350 [Anaerolineae bacterium]|nr:hypothetical protein [Anaerolineae bacterium]